MIWVFIGVVACGLLGWYLYQRSKNDTSEDTDLAAEVDDNSDDFEDLLLTGIVLGEVLDDDDENRDSSDDMDADDHDLMDDGGFDDGGSFE